MGDNQYHNNEAGHEKEADVVCYRNEWHFDEPT